MGNYLIEYMSLYLNNFLLCLKWFELELKIILIFMLINSIFLFGIYWQLFKIYCYKYIIFML